MVNMDGTTIGVGAQIITWGDQAREKMPQILAFIHKQGYTGVEAGWRHFDLARPKEFKELLVRHEMQLVAVHSGGRYWEEEQAKKEMANTEKAIQFAASVGCPYFALSGSNQETTETIKTTVEAYNRIGRLCRDAGLQLAYHNHNWEFVGDGALYRTILDNTDSDLVRLLPDVAWLHRAGRDPVAFLEEHKERIEFVHLKDTLSDRFCELGAGSVDLDRILMRLPHLGVDWCVVEQDTTDTTPEQSLAMSANYLRRNGLL